MSRTRKTGENAQEATYFEALPAGTVSRMEGEAASDEEAAFEEFVEGLGAEKMGILRVGKLKPGRDGVPLANTRSAHCFTCPIDQYTFDELLEYLRDHFGPGLYRVLGIPSGERVRFNKIVEVAEDFKPKKPPPASDGSVNAANPAALLESFSRMIAESQSRTEQLISRMNENRAPTVDPMESLAKMMTVMQPMIAMITGARPAGGGGGDDLLTQLEKLGKIKELLGGFGGGGDSDKESNFYDVVKTGLSSFGPAIAALAMKGAQTPQIPVLPNSQPSIVTPHAPASYDKPGRAQPQNPASDPAMASFKKQVDTLVQNAKIGADPNQLAEMILDMTPDEKLNDLATMIEDAGVIDKMAMLNSEVNQHRPFFEKLRAGILSLLEEDEPVTVAPTGTAPAGDSGAPTS